MLISRTAIMANIYQCLFYTILFTIRQSSSLEEDPYRFIPSRGKPVVMSSTEGDHEGSYATDGDYNTYDVTSGALKYSETTASDNPYLQIDLGSSINVKYVQISVPRTKVDNYIHTVTIGDDAAVDSNSNHECTSKKMVYLNFVSCVREGRYVTIRKTGVDVKLVITELAVHNIPVENLAYMKTAESSIYFSNSYTALKALDMNPQTRFVSGGGTTEVWIRVDLESEYLVYEIVIVAGPMCCADQRLHNVDIVIGNSLDNNGNSNPACVTNEVIFSGQIQSYFCKMFGRFINLKRFSRSKISMDVTEIIVNPEKTNNIALYREAFSDTAGYPGFATPSKMTDGSPTSCFLTQQLQQPKRLWVDLGQSYHIAKIHIHNQNGIMSQLFETKIYAGASNDHTTSTQCFTGPQFSRFTKIRFAPFYCEPRVFARFVILHRPQLDRKLGACEISVYEEAEPYIMYPDTKKRYRRITDKSDITLTCEAKGYPVPVITWVKDNEVIESTSNTLQLTNIKCNQSGRYECWANNTHGVDAKAFDIQFQNNTVICARYKEVNVAIGKEQSGLWFLPDLWYKFFDPATMNELEIKESAPGPHDTCVTWLKCKHPKFKDGVQLCDFCTTRNGVEKCKYINVRRCSTYYVYSFIKAERPENICFRKVQDIHGGFQPVMASPVKKHALSDKVFHTETNISKYYECLMMCQLEKKCKSFNYSKKLKTCQLNDGTKKEFPKKYGFNEDYDYYEMGRGVVMATKIDL